MLLAGGRLESGNSYGCYYRRAMYKTKPRFRCTMPSDAPLNVLALNASLKHEPTLSNTGELASLVLDEIRALAPISAHTVRLSDAALPVGLGFREAPDDDWPDLVTQIKAACARISHYLGYESEVTPLVS